jgi:hypothetical protein
MTIKSIAAAVDGSTSTFVRSDGTAATPGGGGGGGAPTTASYVTLGTDGTLSNERVLTAGDGIQIVDGGAGAAVTISTDVGGAGDSISTDTVLTAGGVRLFVNLSIGRYAVRVAAMVEVVGGSGSDGFLLDDGTDGTIVVTGALALVNDAASLGAPIPGPYAFSGADVVAIFDGFAGFPVARADVAADLLDAAAILAQIKITETRSGPDMDHAVFFVKEKLAVVDEQHRAKLNTQIAGPSGDDGRIAPLNVGVAGHDGLLVSYWVASRTACAVSARRLWPSSAGQAADTSRTSMSLRSSS